HIRPNKGDGYPHAFLAVAGEIKGRWCNRFTPGNHFGRMASHRLVFTFLVFTCVLLSLTSPSSGDQNVTLSVYYESLCPYCADFIVNHLAKVFDQGLISITNLRMVPWGNSFIKADGTFACQHGPNECLLNAVEACSITIYPDVDRHFRFIHCVERLSLENKLNEWVNCFDMSRLGKVPIDCYTSGYGNVLERKYAAETSQLNPPHRFVPWVVVNNQPLQEDFENFASYVCKAYKGPRVPEVCKSLPSENNPLQKKDALNSVLISGKVNISVYYEALSPTSSHFIVQNLSSVFDNGLIDIINLRMVPFGNANFGGANNTIVCQNGPDKCKFNSIQACAIYVWHDVNKYYGFIYCIELLAIEGRYQDKDWQCCFDNLGLSAEPVLDCHNSGNGTKLEILNGDESLHLNPPLTSVPWVVVNNQSIGEDYQNFATYVCNAYNGSHTNDACESLQQESSLIEDASPAHPVVDRRRKTKCN
ncbi:hypothetical protein Tsubulata_017892, partial [Turnera subulata]